jgi:acyl-CoA reductase-like NAD-dependent aldehyde dehydrogenase
VIWDNTFNRFDPTASFGGYKESGFGREGGPSGLAAYLNTDDEAVVAPAREATPLDPSGARKNTRERAR